MSKHQKHRRSMDAPETLAVAQTQSQSPATGKSLLRRTAWQIVGVLGASAVLGFAFNTSSPLGIRFADADSDLVSKKITTEPASPVAAPPTNQLAAVTPASPTENLAPKQAAGLPPPSAPAAEKLVSARILTPALPVAPPLPATTAHVAPTQINPTSEQNPSAIHWAQAKALVDAGQAVLVDVRAKPMYDAGHIPGAFSLPEASSPEEFTTFLNQYSTNMVLILYCSSVSCSQSARVANRFVTEFQRPSVKYMTGGYQEYQQAEAAKNANPPAK